MTPDCIDACVICDIDGYVGINDDSQGGQEPPGFCTSTAHHMQWIAFIAGSEDLTITVTPSGCDNGDGLEVGIYLSLDCDNFQLVSNCDGDIQEGQVGVFTNTVPLIVGQYYYFVMDGNLDDVCNYVINVVSGTTLVPPLPELGPIQGPFTICEDQLATYSIPEITGATYYTWTLDGVNVGQGDIEDIAFSQPGVHELCISAYNVCDTAAPVCQLINVLPSGSSQTAFDLCANDCVTIGDTTLCDPGVHTLHFTNILGCDSTVIVTINELSFVELDIETSICSTDSFPVGTDWYYAPGVYDIVLNLSSGCDSIIHLELHAIDCEINGQSITVDAHCHGDANGQMTLEVSNGSPPFMYRWQTLDGNNEGEGLIPGINTPVTIGQLRAGTYMITISDNYGNDLILTTTIEEPPELVLEVDVTDFNGFQISCFGAMDGEIQVLATGGKPDYVYAWSNGEAIPQLSSLSPQTLQLTVTDADGCAIIEEFMVAEPEPFIMEALFLDPGCDGINSGLIDVTSISGGVPPYQYSLLEGAFGASDRFEQLEEGFYMLSALDANGCLVDSSATLTGSLIPFAEAGSDVDLDLGFSTTLHGEVDTESNPLYEWSPPTGLSCIHCLEPVAMPLVTTVYTLSATSEDGCTVKDSLLITVRKSEEDVYIPNVFSPNGDGINDFFTLYSGRSVKEIAKLSIFSRWGDYIIEEHNFTANDPAQGWDGNFKGKPVQSGVYTWIAEVRFLDDEIIRYNGDLTLIR